VRYVSVREEIKVIEILDLCLRRPRKIAELEEYFIKKFKMKPDTAVSAISKTVKHMEKRGLIEAEKDRRGTLLIDISEKGLLTYVLAYYDTIGIEEKFEEFLKAYARKRPENVSYVKVLEFFLEETRGERIKEVIEEEVEIETFNIYKYFDDIKEDYPEYFEGEKDLLELFIDSLVDLMTTYLDLGEIKKIFKKVEKKVVGEAVPVKAAFADVLRRIRVDVEGAIASLQAIVSEIESIQKKFQKYI